MGKKISRHGIRKILIALYKETTGCGGMDFQVLSSIHMRLDSKNRLLMWDLLTPQQRQEIVNATFDGGQR